MRNQPLKLQLILWTILLVTIPSLLIMTIYTLDRIETGKQEKLELVSQRIEYSKYIIEDWIAERARDVREISRLEAFQVLDNNRMKNVLELMQSENKEFDSLSFIDREGVFQISTLPAGIRFNSAVGKPYFETAFQGKEYISDVVIGRNSGLPIINLSSPVFGKNGEFQGLILGSIRTETLDKVLSKQWFGQTGEILLVNQNGFMIAKPRYINKLMESRIVDSVSPTDIRVTESALRNIRFGEDGSATWVDYLDNKVLGAYRYIPERGWSLVGKINEEEILAPIYHQLTVMAISVIVLIFILLPLATMITTRFKRLIDWLIIQAELISAQQYSLVGRNDYKGTLPNEIRLLCDAFTAMSHKVERSFSLHRDKLLEAQTINTALQSEVTERQSVQNALVERNDELESEVDLRTRELKQSERSYRTLVENSPDIITRYDHHFRLIYGNPAFAKTAGVSLDQVIGKVWSERGGRIEEYSEWATKMESVFQTGTTLEFETDWLCAQGQRSFAVRFIPEFNQYNQVETILCIGKDITNQKQLESELARYDRLNVVGEMAASIGHEVRNPMTTVRGYLQYYSSKEKFAEYCEDFGIMIDEIDRANSIITEFLSLAKNKKVEKARGNFNSLISAIFPLLQADALCRGHEILLDLAKLPDSEFDDKEMRQLILNLVRNSFEAIDVSGKVIIRTFTKENSILLEVEDNGPGISGKVMEKLGTPFITTKERGTGLGLPVCYRIVERHGAKMTVRTGPSGTTFSITFPSLLFD